MTRIGVVTEWFARGSSYVSRAYIETFKNAGFEVAILARGEFEDLGSERWDFENLTLARRCSLPVAKAIRRTDFEAWVKNVKPDVIFFNEQVWICPVKWANAMGIPTVAYVDYYTRHGVREMSAYDLLVCNTKRHAGAMSWHPNVLYVPWGTRLTDYEAPIKYSGSNSGLTFVHSAGWNPYRKGTDQVLRAFARLKTTNASLKIAIQGSKKDLEVLLANHELWILDHPRLEIFQGTHGSEFYTQGDVYVYPSRLDGIGLTQVEALASGLPILVPDEPPMSEFAVAPHSMTVPVVKRRRRIDDYFWPEVEVSVDDLARAMDSYVNSPQRSQWTSDTREFARDFLDWTKNSADLPHIIEGLIGSHTHQDRHLDARCAFGGFASELPSPWSAVYGVGNRLRNRVRSQRRIAPP